MPMPHCSCPRNYTSAVFRTIPPPPNRLLAFARLPERGRVKRRLAEELGEDRTLALYEAMLHDTFRSIGQPNEELEIEVLWAPTPNASGEALRRAFGDLPLSMQSGTDLSERMSMAFSERFFFHRTQKIVAVGVDIPLLPRSLIDYAFGLLESCDWVIGPATDGGYYLIGCRAGSFDTEVFLGIDWGTSSVLTSTLDRIRYCQNTVALLPERSDLDVPEDLRRYAATASHGEVAELLREWKWG
jgi:uncharacterized protein